MSVQVREVGLEVQWHSKSQSHLRESQLSGLIVRKCSTIYNRVLFLPDICSEQFTAASSFTYTWVLYPAIFYFYTPTYQNSMYLTAYSDIGVNQDP